MKSINYKSNENVNYINSTTFYAMVSKCFARKEAKKVVDFIQDRLDRMEKDMSQQEIEDDEFNCEFVITESYSLIRNAFHIAFGRDCAFLVKMNGDTTQFIILF